MDNTFFFLLIIVSNVGYMRCSWFSDAAESLSTWADYVPVVGDIKSVVHVVSGNYKRAQETNDRINMVYNHIPIVGHLNAGVLSIVDKEEGAKAFNTVNSVTSDLADGIPVVGHIKSGVHYAMGDNEKGDKAMKSATSNTGGMIGGAAGIACGPLAPLCMPAGAILGQTAIDSTITVIEDKPYGNVDYVVNFKNKTALDHALMGVGVGLDTFGGFGASKVLKNSGSYAVEKAAKSAVIKPDAMSEVVKMPTKTRVSNHFDTQPVIPFPCLDRTGHRVKRADDLCTPIQSQHHVPMDTSEIIDLDVAKQIKDDNFVYNLLKPFSVEKQKFGFAMRNNLDLDTDKDIIRSYIHFMDIINDLTKQTFIKSPMDSFDKSKTILTNIQKDDILLNLKNRIDQAKLKNHVPIEDHKMANEVYEWFKHIDQNYYPTGYGYPRKLDKVPPTLIDDLTQGLPEIEKEIIYEEWKKFLSYTMDTNANEIMVHSKLSDLVDLVSRIRDQNMKDTESKLRKSTAEQAILSKIKLIDDSNHLLYDIITSFEFGKHLKMLEKTAEFKTFGDNIKWLNKYNVFLIESSDLKIVNNAKLNPDLNCASCSVAGILKKSVSDIEVSDLKWLETTIGPGALHLKLYANKMGLSSTNFVEVAKESKAEVLDILKREIINNDPNSIVHTGIVCGYREHGGGHATVYRIGQNQGKVVGIVIDFQVNENNLAANQFRFRDIEYLKENNEYSSYSFLPLQV